MKKFIFACVLAISGLSAPLFAGFGNCCVVDNDPCSCCEGELKGFYVGGNVGVLSHTAHRNDLDGFLTDNSGWSTINTGVTVGVQAGYDWVCHNTLYGIVGDWGWTNVDHRLYDNPNAVPNDLDNLIHSEMDWFSTIRARAGLIVCSTLVYVTGGAAVAHYDTRWFDDPADFHNHDVVWGWTGGVGTEFSLGCNFSLGAEVLYMQFDDRTHDHLEDSVRFAFGHSDSVFLGRLALNYRFGDWCCR